MRTPTFAVTALFLSGCTTLAGVGGSSTYACKAPEGVHCQSVSGVYANAIQDNLPGSQSATPAPKTAPAPDEPARIDAGRWSTYLAPVASTPESGARPLRTEERVLRLRIFPWEDKDGDLNDGYVYVRIDGGRWLVDHYRPARPDQAASASTAGESHAR